MEPAPAVGLTVSCPGRDNTGTPACRDCSGITRNFNCSRCQREGFLRGGLCRHCCLTDELTTLLDDGTGRIHPPLVDQLRTMANPASGLRWISRPQPQATLAGLASGRLALTQAAFAQLPDGRAAT
jgi:hypothetical protein